MPKSRSARPSGRRTTDLGESSDTPRLGAGGCARHNIKIVGAEYGPTILLAYRFGCYSK